MTLHSTVVLLKAALLPVAPNSLSTLHSTVVLLKGVFNSFP